MLTPVCNVGASILDQIVLYPEQHSPRCCCAKEQKELTVFGVHKIEPFDYEQRVKYDRAQNRKGLNNGAVSEQRGYVAAHVLKGKRQRYNAGQ